MSTSSSIQAHPETAAASASVSPPTPPPAPDESSSINNNRAHDGDEAQEYCPIAPVVNMDGAHDELDEPGQTKCTSTTEVSSGNMIYTPTSTVSSSKADSTYEEEDENSAQPSEGNNRGAYEWWKAEELAAQVGGLSKELIEVKAMIEKQTFNEEASDLCRLKANHRSSLASLAEFHRSEMAGLNSAHTETMKKIELQHMEELRDARRNNGHDRDLILGLHQSYSKQIECLVMDLSEARRELKEMKLKQSPSASTGAPVPIDPAVEEVLGRTLTMRLAFDNMDARLSIAELSVPHPGRSFNALLRLLSFSVRNHLQALNTIANVFICHSREEHVEAATKIRHWYNSALEEKVHFSFTTDGHEEGASMQDQWEAEHWKGDEFVLEVLCTAEGWETLAIPPYPPEVHKDATIIQESINPLCVPSSTERPLPLETPLVEPFNTAAELERINRELSNLQLHQQLQKQELQACEEDKENLEPLPPLPKSRKATVESVRDEYELSLANEVLPSAAVPIIKPPKPRQPQTPVIPLIWEDSQPTKRTILEEGLREFLERDLERAQIKAKTTGSPDSWLFDNLFSPMALGQGKDKEEGVEIVPQNATETMQPSLFKENNEAGRHPGRGWRWLSDNTVEPPSIVSRGNDNRPAIKQGVELPARDTHTKTISERADSLNKGSLQFHHGPEHTAEHPLFNFTDAQSSPAIPPAPLGPKTATHDSPTLPGPAQCDAAACHDQGESVHCNDEEAQAADAQGEYSNLKSAPPCDTPVMGTAHSVVSSTPLLGSDATSHKSVRFRTKRSYTDELSGQRMPPPPFPPLSNSGREHGSPRSSQYSASRYEDAGYFRSGDNGDMSQAPPDRWGGTRSSAASDYESETTEGGNKGEFGQGPDSYAWSQNQEEDEGAYRPGSISPPLSRSSTTTTDRRSPFIAPNIYPQIPGGSTMTPTRYGLGSIRPMAMGPLGPRSGIQSFANPQHAEIIFQQQMRNRMEEMMAGNFGPLPRSSTAPAYSGGPVFAPNPPHSVAARSGGGGVPVNSFMSGQGSGSAVSGSVANGAVVNGLTRYPFDGWPMSNLPLHVPHHHHHHHMFNPNGERRSFSTDSISPLLWSTGNPMTGDSMPGLGHSPSNSNHNHNHDQPPQNYSGMGMGPWQLGGNMTQLQSSTPVSQVHGHGMPPPQAWFQQPNVPPFEVQWDGSPIPMNSMSSMRIPGSWGGGGYSA